MKSEAIQAHTQRERKNGMIQLQQDLALRIITLKIVCLIYVCNALRCANTHTKKQCSFSFLIEIHFERKIE